jgi:hypothetical protein
MRALSEAELARRYDRLMQLPVVAPVNDAYTLEPDDYLAELHRRESERRIKAMESLTRWILVLMIAVAVLTAVNVAWFIWKT